jgi:hypothetical protein
MEDRRSAGILSRYVQVMHSTTCHKRVEGKRQTQVNLGGTHLATDKLLHSYNSQISSPSYNHFSVLGEMNSKLDNNSLLNNFDSHDTIYKGVFPWSAAPELKHSVLNSSILDKSFSLKPSPANLNPIRNIPNKGEFNIDTDIRKTKNGQKHLKKHCSTQMQFKPLPIKNRYSH